MLYDMNVGINQTLAGLKEPPGRFSRDLLVFLKKKTFFHGRNAEKDRAGRTECVI